MNRLTMSSLHRAERCVASVHLPHVVDERFHDYRERGVALHAYLATRELSGVPAQFQAEAAAINFEALDDVGLWTNEVAFVLDVETGAAQVIGSNIGRKYPKLEPSEIAGAADLVGLTGDAVVVLDLKSGNGPLPPPDEALQTLAYAVAAANAYGRSAAYVGWLRLFSGNPVFQWAKLDGFALSEALQRIRDVVRRVAAEPDSGPVLGSHCTFCPAQLRCPATVTTLATLVGKAGLVINEEDMPDVVERLEAAEAAVKAARAIVDDIARARPVKLLNGEVYGLVELKSERLDAERTQEVLGATLPEAFETKVTVSKSSVRRALQKRVQATGEKITKVMDATLEALRAAGATRTQRYETVKRFHPRTLKEET